MSHLAFSPHWPILNRYDTDHLARIALPLGGIGTGTVSLGGRGDLRDWEIMNRPAKGYTPPIGRYNGPFAALVARRPSQPAILRLLEGPLELGAYEGSHGSRRLNHGLPRFRQCAFAAAYPLGQVSLRDEAVPLDVRLEALNPLIPADAERSSLPVALLRYVLRNPEQVPVQATVSLSLPNFIGQDGSQPERGWCNELDFTVGPDRNRNAYRAGDACQGLHMWSEGVDPRAPSWGTMALVTGPDADVTYRTAWAERSWGDALLDYWDDLAADGRLSEREQVRADGPVGSLAVSRTIPPGGETHVPFLIAWHFPNRLTWQPQTSDCSCGINPADWVGNHYATRFADAWDVAQQVWPQWDELERDTLRFVQTFCDSDLPAAIKEAALNNVSTLRSQTTFRIASGELLGWEGSCDTVGCCHGSCTHVWNYEQTVPFLYGELAATMREVEFDHATDERGLMSFRVQLPLARAQEHGLAAADGQMGCLPKLYREWQLCGDDDWLRRLWPHAKRALAFAWIPGGWDADQDGVMEGCQHNTMDVEYYGPNPQMGAWYLAALRAGEAMARHLGDDAFATRCAALAERGSRWMDEHLFNGDYYEHHIQPLDAAQIAEGLRVGMGSDDLSDPDLQLGAGCLVDQLVGQYMARVCGLGDLLDRDHVRRTLQSIIHYNYKSSFHDHFNHLRSFVLGDEAGLLMATYPRGRRPVRPFPYYNEVMTGFEYSAAVHMLYEGLEEEGLRCIQAIRDRYDGRKRSPFDEAECGHHYARAMAAWAALLAWTGFHYSAITGELAIADRPGTFFWANGYAWGTYTLDAASLTWRVLHGQMAVKAVRVGERSLDETATLRAGQAAVWGRPSP